jgi:hypothetical protein
MEEKEEKVTTAMILSKLLIAMKILKLHIEWLPLLVKQTRLRTIDIEYFTDNLVKTLDEHIFDVQYKLGILLKDLFKEKNFGYNSPSHWKITAQELKQGYIILDETNDNGDYLGVDCRHVLFLIDYKDNKFNIQQGDLLPFNTIKSILGNIRDSSYSNENSLDINDYHKRTLNLISTAKGKK